MQIQTGIVSSSVEDANGLFVFHARFPNDDELNEMKTKTTCCNTTDCIIKAITYELQVFLLHALK